MGRVGARDGEGSLGGAQGHGQDGGRAPTYAYIFVSDITCTSTHTRPLFSWGDKGKKKESERRIKKKKEKVRL